MMIEVSRWLVVLFGVYLIGTGFLMLFNPKKANQILRKAGSTNFINYAEISIRLIASVAIVIYAESSKYPEVLKIFGWFMLVSSVILYFVPRRLHHNYSVRAAEILKPFYFQLLSPLAMAFGLAVLWSVRW